MSIITYELKLTAFTHADAGQMHMYLNYAKAHWTLPDENPPVGLILCAEKDAAVAYWPFYSKGKIIFGRL